MKAHYLLDDSRKNELLRGLMLAWDGQWFIKIAERFGMEDALLMNEAVGNAVKKLIARMSLRAWNREKADDFMDAGRMMQSILDWTQGGYMHTSFDISTESIRIAVSFCQAYEGARKANLKRMDQACLNCQSMWPIWIETLLPGQKVAIDYASRISQGDATCLIHIRKS